MEDSKNSLIYFVIFKQIQIDCVDPTKKAAFLIVKSVPSWSFMAMGSTEEEARKEAIKEAVQFMIIMRR